MAKIIVMWKVGFFISCFLLCSCASYQSQHSEALSTYNKIMGRVEDTTQTNSRLKQLSQDIDEVEVVVNNNYLLKYYLLYKSELKNRGIFIPNEMLEVKYLFIEEGITNGPDLMSSGKESLSNKDKRYILFSPLLKENEDKIKASLYRELTLNLELGLTGVDSKILEERTSDYDYSKITKKDYDKLFNLIKQRRDKLFVDVVIPVVGN